jgi:hypothetical protein
MNYRLALTSLCLVAACAKQPEPGAESSTGVETSTAGDETFGMGVTSATEGDPTKPPTTTDDVTSMSSISTLTFPDTDPTAPPTITDDPDSESVGPGSDPTFPDTSTTFPPDTTTDPNCPDPANQPQSAACTDASGCGCASGFCFLVPILGGFCGECLVDADCGDGGCTVPNPLGNIGATCNTGQAGDGCMTDDVCSDPQNDICATILSVPGIINVATCGECVDTTDCPGNAPNCSPVYDIPNFTGTNTCVPNGSVPNNGGCNLAEDNMNDPVGNKACDSGFCGEANVMGLLKLGICGECNSDSDCQPGDFCSDPVVDLEQGTLVGSVCQ